MTSAPGASRNRKGGSPSEYLRSDLRELRDAYRTDTLVCLLEEDELRYLGTTDLEACASDVGISVVGFAIRDGEIPNPLTGVRSLVELIVADLDAGRVVVVSCMGGLGRTGTIVACVLVELGAEPSAAIRDLRSARPGVVETSKQMRFVGGFSKLKN